MLSVPTNTPFSRVRTMYAQAKGGGLSPEAVVLKFEGCSIKDVETPDALDMDDDDIIDASWS